MRIKWGWGRKKVTRNTQGGPARESKKAGDVDMVTVHGALGQKFQNTKVNEEP